MTELYIDADMTPYTGAMQSAAFLVGGYAGWPNFGDYLQLKATLDMHGGIAAHRVLFVILDARARPLLSGSRLDRAIGRTRVLPLYYLPEGTAADTTEGLVRLPQLPRSVLVHLYGGGFVNDWWGEFSRRALGTLVDRHAREHGNGCFRLFMSGLQVSPSREVEAWRPYFMQADYIGVRDRQTASLLQEVLGTAKKIYFSGDDALLTLAKGCGETDHTDPRTIAAHINLAYYSANNGGLRVTRVAEVLAAAARRLGPATTCDLLVAFKDDFIREQEAAEQLEACYTRVAAEQRAPPLAFRHRDLFEEAVNATFSLRSAFLVTCSYHVALSGLLFQCPTVLLVENDYYRQKAGGLVEVFGTHRFALLEPKDSVEETVCALLGKPCGPSAGNAPYAMWIGQAEKALHLCRVCLDTS